jgi:hypothetical protein
MSSHRASVMLQRLQPVGLSGRRVQEAKELYAPELSREGHAPDERGSVGEEGDVLVRRAERRVGKKALVLKAWLLQPSCKAGEEVRLKGTCSLFPIQPTETDFVPSKCEESHDQSGVSHQGAPDRYPLLLC